MKDSSDLKNEGIDDNGYAMCIISGPDAVLRGIASAAVEKKLAACAQVTKSITSFYRWEGKVKSDEEALVFLKTRSGLLPQIERLVSEMHTYEVPEIIAVPLSYGYKPYLDWMNASLK